jgi:ubiquinone/menaquinone biosynthesis C-methylase UbiE
VARALTAEESRRFYDRFGRLQDLQALHKDRAVEALLEAGDFGAARAVFELGCGTGLLARRLFDELLSDDARYVGVDVSERMLALTERRLAPFAARAEVRRSDGGVHLPDEEGSFDRFLSVYVFDLLSEDDMRSALSEAERVLADDGRLCLVSLAEAEGLIPRALCRAWTGLHGLSPSLVGGCRPVALVPLVESGAFEIEHRAVHTAFGFPSEVVVARRRRR